MTFSATVKSTGEVVEVDASTPDAVIESYRYINEYIKTLESIKAKLQAKAADVVGPDGTYTSNGYMLRVSNIQRMNYDKSVLREVFDEDTLDLFLEPAKSRIDNYIKENLETLGPDSTKLRESMIPAGNPYTTVRLEKLETAA